MKSLVFDTSSIISIATNNLLWVLPELKKRFRGEFYIVPAVKEEVIDVPIKSIRYKLEAMQILSLIGDGQIKVYRNSFMKKKEELAELANKIFRKKDMWIRIMHDAELESLALVLELNASAYVIDERNTRMLIENPESLGQLLKDKLHTDIEIDYENLERFKQNVKEVNVIRSAELMTVAYELGIMDNYLKKEEKAIIDIDLEKNLLHGMLWGLKLNGCAITKNEINEVVRTKS
ncbi:MAG: hypothetical protein QW404_00735 [Candidatus Nanoarchaeia archaeon]